MLIRLKKRYANGHVFERMSFEGNRKYLVGDPWTDRGRHPYHSIRCDLGSSVVRDRAVEEAIGSARGEGPGLVRAPKRADTN